MKKFKRALSVISATVMSGLCVFSNMTIANAYSNTEYPIGALEDTQSQWNELYSQFDQSFSSIDLNNITSVPTSCDLSTNADKKYLPPIVSALTQKYTKYMIDNNFDESEIVEMQDITKYIKNRMTVDSMI